MCSQEGYPRIYATGFDNAGNEACRPVYQARSQLNAEISRPIIPSALFTVDFGVDGAHNVTVNQATINNQWTSAGASIVYTSPGYIGCRKPEGHYLPYYSPLREVKDAFTVEVESIDVELGCDSPSQNEKLNLTISAGNSSEFVSLVSSTFNETYENGPFDVAVSWIRKTTGSEFAVQIDFGKWTLDHKFTPPATTQKFTPATSMHPKLTPATSMNPQFTPATTPPSSPALSTPAPEIFKDSYCDCAVDKFGMPSGWNSTEIWLDIVFVLDTSEAMGEDFLEDASSLIESLIGDDDYDVLMTDSRAPFYTRIGVIAMSDSAQILFNLNMTKADSVSDRVRVAKGVKQINVIDAFTNALDMFAQGIKSRPERSNTRQVIYYLTDSPADVQPTQVQDFKSQGTIIVERFMKKGDSEDNGLKQLASEGYYFKTNAIPTIQVFCNANCFCPPDHTPYRGQSTDTALIAAGGCFRAPSTGLQFSKAVKSCSNNNGGRLASVHDSQKGAFLNDLVIGSTDRNYYFWIGYSKGDDGKWNWEDQSTDPYTNWDKNEPSGASVAKCAYVDQTQQNLPWGAGNCQIVFPYVCEYTPCSVGNSNC